MKESEQVIYLKKLVSSLRKRLATAEARIDKYHAAYLEMAGKAAQLEAEVHRAAIQQ